MSAIEKTRDLYNKLSQGRGSLGMTNLGYTHFKNKGFPEKSEALIYLIDTNQCIVVQAYHTIYAEYHEIYLHSITQFVGDKGKNSILGGYYRFNPNTTLPIMVLSLAIEWRLAQQALPVKQRELIYTDCNITKRKQYI